MTRPGNLRIILAVAAVAICVSYSPMQAQQQPGKPQLSVEKIAQLGTRRFRHGSMIRQLSLAPDRRVVATGGRKLRVWNLESGELSNEVRLTGSSKVYFDGDSRAIITKSRKNGVPTHTIQVVDANTGEQISQWNSPRWVEQVAVGHDTDFAVLGNLNRTVSIVDLKTGRERDQIEYLGPKSKEAWRPYVKLSPDSRRLAVEVRSNYIRFYSLADDGKVERLLSTVDSNSFHNAVFSSRKDEVVLLGSQTSSLWNTRSGKLIVRWREPGPNRPSDAVFADDGQVIAELADNVVRLRETKTGKELRQFPIHAVPRVDCLALSPDETVLAAGGLEGRVRLYEFKTGREIGFVADEETRSPAEAVAISDDGKWIASAEYKGRVSLWNHDDGWRRRVCPDEDIRSGQQYDTSAGPNFVTFLPGKSKLLAGSCRFHNSVNLWDAATASRYARFVGHGMPITGVVTSQDGQVIVSSGRSSTRVWNSDGKQQPAKFKRANSVAISPDGRLIALPCERELPRTGHDGIPDPRQYVPAVEIWNVTTGKYVRSMADILGDMFGYGIYSVSFSHDGRLLAGMAEEGLYIWDVATGKRTRLFPVPQPEREQFWHAPVRGCAFSPKENIVAVPTGAGEIYFVDAEAQVDGQWQLAIAKGHDGAIASVAWQRDGSHLVSGGSDSTILLWKIDRVAAD